MSGARSDSAAAIGAIAAEAKEWLFDAAALWAAIPQDGAALFPERLSLHGERDAGPHRLFVQARHIFAFCEIGRLGWAGPWRERVEASARILIQSGRREDGLYVHALDGSGAVCDARADLYDQAFVLLALAHAGRALGDGRLFAAAEALDAELEARWRLEHGHYHEGEIALCPPHRQNPHMHLLEGFLALHAASGASHWRARAERIADLSTRHFIEAETGALLEYFDHELRPAAGEVGLVAEPGHCFEWAWLFERLAMLGLPGAIAASDRLVAFARSRGLRDEGTIACNEVLTDGTVRNGDARLWPQTERLKAALARWRRTRQPSEADEAVSAHKGLVRYFDTPRRGVWRDKLRADGSWVHEPAPGSSLYHLTCALAELIDTAGQG